MDELKVWLKLLLRPLIPMAIILGVGWLLIVNYGHKDVPLVMSWKGLVSCYLIMFVVGGGDDLWDATGKLLDRLPPGFQTIRAKIRKYNDS